VSKVSKEGRNPLLEKNPTILYALILIVSIVGEAEKGGSEEERTDEEKRELQL